MSIEQRLSIIYGKTLGSMSTRRERAMMKNLSLAHLNAGLGDKRGYSVAGKHYLMALDATLPSSEQD